MHEQFLRGPYNHLAKKLNICSIALQNLQYKNYNNQNTISQSTI